jgi:hypothetical protein
MSAGEITGIIILAIAIFIYWLMHSDSGDKPKEEESHDQEVKSEFIPDSKVTKELTLEYLKNFKPIVRESRKNGFTEKDIHEDLEKHLKKYFHSVTREHGIEGKNTKRIDFDIGNGKIGLEIKLAESVIKEGESDRLIGQLRKYSKRKYDHGNIIVALMGYADHERNTVIHEIMEDITSENALATFVRIPKKRT